MQEIVLDFYPNGQVKVETFGFTGSACQDATAFLDSLGSKTEEELKPEYFAQEGELVYA
jgi:hypothetical protein